MIMKTTNLYLLKRQQFTLSASASQRMHGNLLAFTDINHNQTLWTSCPRQLNVFIQ